MGGVTVVIPFWDLDQNILKDCVRSVQAQSEACEILVVDNCSTIPVPSIPGTRVTRLAERVSVGKARTLGLEDVNTPYVMFMDADDKLLPGAVSHLRRLLAKNPGASLAAGRIIDWIPETGDKRVKPWPSNFAHWANAFSARLYRACNALRNMTPVTGCAVMVTDMARATGGFPDTAAEDWTFGVAMSFQGPVLLSTREVKLYRWRQDGLSKQQVKDIKGLLVARAATRRAVRTESGVPAWMKALLPLIAIVHLFELPFHIRRELSFASVPKISAKQPLIVTPDQRTVPSAIRRRPVPTAGRLGIASMQSAKAARVPTVSAVSAAATGTSPAQVFTPALEGKIAPALKLKRVWPS